MNQPHLPAYSNRPNRRIVDDATSGLGAARPPSISRNGNRFTMVDASGNPRPCSKIDEQGNIYVDVVIVDANPSSSRMYFDKPYDPNAITHDPPACWSDNGTGPSALASKPQSLSCAVCPHAAWGSAVSKMDGKPVTACESLKKLAVITVDDLTPLVFEFTVKAGSWSHDTGWKRYTSTLKQHGVDVCDVVTRISFVPTSSGVLSFQPRPGAGFVEGPLVQRVEAAWASGECPKVCGMLDVARDPNLPLLAKPVAQEAPRGQMPPPPQQGTPTPPFLQNTTHELAPAKKPGRPRKEQAPAAQPNPPSGSSGGEALDIPPFLQRAPAPSQQMDAMKAQNAGSTAQFGLQQAPPPDAGLQKALADAFNLPIGGSYPNNQNKDPLA